MKLSVVGIYPWHEIPEYFQKWLKDDSKVIVEMDKMTVGRMDSLQDSYDKMGAKDVAIVCNEADKQLITQLETLTEDSPNWWEFWQEVECLGNDNSVGGWQSWSDTHKD